MAMKAFDEMYGLGEAYGREAGDNVTAAYRSIQAWLDHSPPALMEARRINTLLVVDAAGVLVGAVSTNDLMRAKVI